MWFQSKNKRANKPRLLFYFHGCMKTALFAILTSLCSAGFASDIRVSITKDVVAKDGECSLREAVAFLNADGKDDKHDCFPKDSSVSRAIVLKAKAKEPYRLNKEILISTNMTIKADNAFSIRNNNAAQKPAIKTKAGRIFVIDDGSTSSKSIAVTLDGLELVGAQAKVANVPDEETDSSSNNKNDDKEGAQISIAVDKPKTAVIDEGGIIFNREKLRLLKSRLIGGAAKQGGAIYSASTDAALSIEFTEFRENYADQGAAVFSETMSATVKNTLFHLNSSINSQNNQPELAKTYVFHVAQAQRPSTIPKIEFQNAEQRNNDFYRIKMVKSLASSIFFDNRAGAFVLQSPMLVNNVTVVNNDRGVFFDNRYTADNPGQRQIISAQLANSVLLGNSAYDMYATSDDNSFTNHLVVNKILGGRDITNAKLADSVVTLAQSQINNLLAKVQVSEKGQPKTLCRAPTLGEKTGLFCPLVRLDREFVPALRPRLLMSYATLTDSPIVNKAANVLKTGDNRRNIICEKTDMRDQKRVICDIGAFELTIKKERSGRKRANAEITFGDNAFIYLKDALGDGELVPRGYCESLFAQPNMQRMRSTNPAHWPSGVVGQWSDGCLLYVENKEPKKGKLTVNQQKNQLEYIPDSDWHGYDDFEYFIVTTTSRFSSSPNEIALRVRSIVRQDPPDNVVNRTIELGYKEGSGGVGFGLFGFLSALGLLSFAARRKALSRLIGKLRSY